MNKIYKIMFTASLVMGTLITMSSYSWMTMWIGLEINMLAFIPIMKSNNNIYPSESSMKYFMVQALASALILMSIIINLSNFNELYNLMEMNMQMSLLMKLGAAPMHFWLPEIMEGLNWTNGMILLTWQKIAPFSMLSYSNMNNPLMYTAIILSSMVGGLIGFNQVSLNKIMALSSVNHLAWMMTTLYMNSFLWAMYFMMYTMISMSMMLMFNMNNMFKIKQLLWTMNNNKKMKLMISMTLLSLGGLPPFTGFLMKWMTINLMLEKQLFLLGVLLSVTTLITLYFYTRLMFSSLTIKSNEPIFMVSPTKNKLTLTTMIFLSNFTLPASTMLMVFQ